MREVSGLKAYLFREPRGVSITITKRKESSSFDDADLDDVCLGTRFSRQVRFDVSPGLLVAEVRLFWKQSVVTFATQVQSKFVKHPAVCRTVNTRLLTLLPAFKLRNSCFISCNNSDRHEATMHDDKDSMVCQSSLNEWMQLFEATLLERDPVARARRLQLAKDAVID